MALTTDAAAFAHTKAATKTDKLFDISFRKLLAVKRHIKHNTKATRQAMDELLSSPAEVALYARILMTK